MHELTRRSATLAGIALAAIALAGCGGRVAQQPGSSEPPAAKVRALQRVGAAGGWVLTDSELAWTAGPGSIGGAITPPSEQASDISAVFFLDPQHGWAGSLATSPSEQGSKLTAFRTADGGATWSLATLTASGAAYGITSIDFVDPRHGYLVAKDQSSSNFSVGELFRTEDGGATWTKVSAPSGGPIRFVTPSLGFMAGGPISDRLYRTTDAGRTWRQQPVALPSEFSAAQPAYALPTFADDRSGVLPVTLLPRSGAPAVAFYRTDDGGGSWTLAGVRLVPEATGTFEAGIQIPTAVVSPGDWVVASDKRIYSSDDGGRSWKAISPNGLAGGVDEIDFATPSEGWGLIVQEVCSGTTTGCTDVQEARWTTDGGQTWDVIRK